MASGARLRPAQSGGLSTFTHQEPEADEEEVEEEEEEEEEEGSADKDEM